MSGSSGATGAPVKPDRRAAKLHFSQDRIVLSIAAIIFVLFSVALPGFADPKNLLSLLQSVSILGVLSVGMSLTIIGRGIDLAMISTMAMSVSWVLFLTANGVGIGQAMLYGYLFVVCIGLVMGWLIAYAEVPAIFATLAMTAVIYGFTRVAFVDIDLVFLPPEVAWIQDIGGGYLLGIPVPVIAFAVVALLSHLFLTYARLGVYLRAMGDNPAAARIAGFPNRPMIVLQYLISSTVAFAAGLLMASLVGTMNTRLVNSTMIYDVILVVVLGGVVLSGGRGGIFNVIVGTLLIGILLNGMTIMNLGYSIQNLIKGAILLIAILVDSYLNPRDEQTSQQGDI